MTHKFKDQIIDWLSNGTKYEGLYCTAWSPINQVSAFDITDRVRKVDEYRHLREALDRGETIEHEGEYGWCEVSNPRFCDPVECYRIKQKTKKMVQWLFNDGTNYHSTNAYFEIGVVPVSFSTKPIKPLPHTEIEVDCE